jgi:hypothetical protein
MKSSSTELKTKWWIIFLHAMHLPYFLHFYSILNIKFYGSTNQSYEYNN